jgi:hypothetical protein
MALHEQSVGATDEWYTPPHVFTKMGCTFDVDVASPGRRITPWIPAERFIDCHSLAATWHGFVWMNAPFGGRNGLEPWLRKFIEHANRVALVPDRTSAPWWQRYAPRADLVLYVAPKLKFIGVDGKPGASPAQGTTLLAIGEQGCAAITRAGRHGLGVLMRPVPGPAAESCAVSSETTNTQREEASCE